MPASMYFSSIPNCFSICFCLDVSAYFLLYLPALFLVHSMFSNSDRIPGTVYALRFFFLSSSIFWNISFLTIIAINVINTKDRTLNTDGKQTFIVVKDRIKVINEAIDYSAANHRLYWLNIIIGNVKNNILGIYHGVSKRNLPLFLKEQEYRFNHRNVGLGMLDKIQQYLIKSAPMKKRTIIRTLDDALPIFANMCQMVYYINKSTTTLN